MKHRYALRLVLTLTLAGPVVAQDKSSYYTVTHPNEFKINWKAFYDLADEMTAAVRKELPHRLDLAYGEDPKQRADIYMPAASPSDSPVFVFLHGGGFREGDRAHYGYVARPFARHGVVTVVASYRLAPQAHYPDQPDDVRRLLTWLYRNVKQYGGNPDRIFVGGHSAGAILAAFVSVKSDWLGQVSLPRDLIKGCVPISGPYDLRNPAGVTDYLPDEARRAEASPLLVVENPSPTVVAVGSVEPYVESSKALVDRIRARGVKADLVVLEGLPHDKTALALGEEQSPLFKAVLALIQPSSNRGPS